MQEGISEIGTELVQNSEKFNLIIWQIRPTTLRKSRAGKLRLARRSHEDECVCPNGIQWNAYSNLINNDNW